MPKAKKEVVKAEVLKVKVLPSEEEKVSVYKPSEEKVRDYSLEVHGKDYKKLAHQFADKNGYFVK